MKFKFNVKCFNEYTKVLFGTSKKEVVTIKASLDSLLIKCRSNVHTGILEFSKEDLCKIDYKCFTGGVITVNASHLQKGVSTFKDVDVPLSFVSNKKSCYLKCNGTRYHLALYPLEEIENTAKPQPQITLKRKELCECMNRIMKGNIRDSYFHFQVKDDCFAVMNGIKKCYTAFTMKPDILFPVNTRVIFKKEDIQRIKKTLLKGTEDTFSVSFEGKKVYLYLDGSISEYNCIPSQVVDKIISTPSTYYYQLISDAKIWKLIESQHNVKRVRKEENSLKSDVNIDFVNGSFSYTYDKYKEYVIADAINYKWNAKYYPADTLKTVPTSFTCDIESLYYMAQMAHPKENIKMYFGVKENSEPNSILVEYAQKSSDIKIYCKILVEM